MDLKFHISKHGFRLNNFVLGSSKLVRGFDAARPSRTNPFRTYGGNQNKDIAQNLRTLRDHFRELVKNNAYAKHWMLMSRINIIGPNGFIFQNKAMLKNGSDLDEYSNDIIEKMFKEASLPENCTIHQDMSLLEVEYILMDQYRRDGEFIVRMVEDATINKFGFALELLDVDSLDETLNMELSNGNVISGGIEFDIYWRKVQYYFKPKNYYAGGPSITGKTRRDYIIVPAHQIIHGFYKEMPRQSRGYPQLAAGIIDINKLDVFDKASLDNATASAMNMGFLQNNKTDELGELENSTVVVNQNGEEVVVDSQGEVFEFENGVYTDIGDKTFVGYDPKFPHEQQEPFNKIIGKRIAAAGGVDYPTLFSDTSESNFANIRHGLADSRDNYKMHQGIFIEKFKNIYFKNLLRNAILNQRTSGVKLDYSELPRLTQPIFMGRRWDYVKPTEDVKASSAAIKFGISTFTEEAAKQGVDFAERIRTKKRELEMLKKEGLELNDKGDIVLIGSGGEGNVNNKQNDDKKKNKIYKIKKVAE